MASLYLVIPVFNEAATLQTCIDRILSAAVPEGWSKRLCFVDDGSVDDTRRILTQMESAGQAVIEHRRNLGKGAAIRTGFRWVIAQAAQDASTEAAASSRDNIVLVQDADLEYSPDDYGSLIEPLALGCADAVIGSRFGRHYKPQSFGVWMHTLGNRILSEMSNLMTGLALTDMESCYKGMTIDILRRIEPMLSENQFGIEPQIAAAWARVKARVCERPIRYEPRSVGQGKKIKWRDGGRAVYVILREGIRG